MQFVQLDTLNKSKFRRKKGLFNPRHVIDQIWDGKSFEVGGHWPLWRG